jgi:hypothetical protein
MGPLRAAARDRDWQGAPVLVEMSLAAHGPRLIEAFLKLKTDKLRGIVTDLVQALARG